MMYAHPNLQHIERIEKYVEKKCPHTQQMYRRVNEFHDVGDVVYSDTNEGHHVVRNWSDWGALRELKQENGTIPMNFCKKVDCGGDHARHCKHACELRSKGTPETKVKKRLERI